MLCEGKGRVGMRWLLGTLVLMGLGVLEADGWQTTSQCVQVGHANFHAQCKIDNLPLITYCPYNAPSYDSKGDINWGNWARVTGAYFTIGAYKFKTTHYFLDAGVWTGDYENEKLVSFEPPTGQSCPYQYSSAKGAVLHRGNFCPTDQEVEIRTFGVRQNGVVMHGWLHFEVELMDKTDELLGIYVQVRDEWYNAIGEFVSKKEEQCGSANPDLLTPTPFQVLPCSAIGFREAKISNALFMVDPIILENKTAGLPYLTSKDLSKSRGIHFTWRLSEYWCNRHLRFRPEAVVFTRKMYNHNNYKNGVPAVYRKAASYWIFPKWYRSADIKLDATVLTCDEKVIDYTKKPVDNETELEENDFVKTWLNKRAEESTLDNDYVSEFNTYLDDSPDTIAENGNCWNCYAFSLQSCHANTRHKNQPSFAGRCKHHFEKYPSHDALQGCNLDNTAPEFNDTGLQKLPTYSEYVHTLTINRTKQCSAGCRPPKNLSDLIAIQQFASSSGPKKQSQVLKFTNIGATRNGSKVQKFWTGRKVHGQLLTFWTMFLIPVGTFASRYLKETAMPHVCIALHMWFWIHLATLILGSGMLGCGFLALYHLINTFGRSLNEFSGIHRILSICSIVLYGLMLVLGGYRSTGMKLRKVLLFLHSFVGFAIYFLNLAAMLLSTWIPASPSMANDCDEDGRPNGLSGVALVILVWLVVDILCHVGMTTLQLVVDRKYGIVRASPSYCPILPFLPPESISDLKGKNFRKIIFLVYMLLCGVFTMAVIFMLDGGNVPEKCRNNTGPSSCEDPWGCSNWAKAYSHRYPQRATVAPQAAN